MNNEDYSEFCECKFEENGQDVSIDENGQIFCEICKKLIRKENGKYK